MSVNIGIVIEVGNPAYEDCAKVRVPALHGLPLPEKVFGDTRNRFVSVTGATNLSVNGSKASEVYKYNLQEFGKSNSSNTANNKVIDDKELPWYPICYPIGSNLGPNQFDIVYVLDNSYIIGWTNKSFNPYN